MDRESEYLHISGLQHLAFCERQWALIHMEQLWEDNVLTVEGKILHEKAHSDTVESRGPVRIVRGLWLRSHRLGLSGVADVVEFHRDAAGIPLVDLPGRWRPFPVEYKRGRSKPGDCDRVQLCAQAICLEEMLSVSIDRGALFYGQPRRREDVELGIELRERVETLCRRGRALMESGILPLPVEHRGCRRCSLNDVCRPDLARSARQYVEKTLEDLVNETLPEHPVCRDR